MSNYHFFNKNKTAILILLILFLCVPPISAATYLGAYDGNLKFLAHFNGTEGQTTTVDSSRSAHTMTFSDGGTNLHLTTALKAFGSSSLYFNDETATRGITISGTMDDFTFGTSPYTFLFYFNHTAGRSPPTMFFGSGSSSTNIYYNGVDVLYFAASASQITLPTDNANHQYIIQRTGTGANQFKVYTDGALVLTGTDANNHGAMTSWAIGDTLAASDDTALIDEYAIWNTAVPVDQLYPQYYEVDQVIPAPPVSSFTTNVTGGFAPLPVQFTDTSTESPTSWAYAKKNLTHTTWELFSTSQNPSHIFVMGNWSVNLTSTNEFGSNISQSTWINVTVQKPVAAFTSDPNPSGQGNSVTFTDQSTFSPTSWDWDFGDLTPHNSTQNATHTYTNPGVFNVTLTVSNDGGSDSITHQQTVLGSVAANFTSYVITGIYPMYLQFTDTSLYATNYQWDFGDGNTSTLQNPSHNYEVCGYMTVSLNASNSFSSDIETKTNYVYNDCNATLPYNPPPSPSISAQFVGSPTYAQSPANISFTDVSTSTATTITNWNWSFGDGEVSNLQNPVHQYSSPGIYTVSLNASSSITFGVMSKNDYIRIDSSPPPSPTPTPAPLIAQFVGTPTFGYNPLAVYFNDLTYGYPTGWTWDFGDNTTSSSQNPIHTYSAVGNYTVSLNATSSTAYSFIQRTAYISVVNPASVPTATPTLTPTPTPTPTTIPGSMNWCGITSIYFEHNTTTDIPGYEQLLNRPSGNAEVDENVTVSSTTGPVLIDTYVSNAGMPGPVTLDAGLRRYTTWHYVDSNVGTTQINFSVYRRMLDGNETKFYTVLTEDIDELAATAYVTPYVSVSNITFSATDRLVIRVSAQTTHPAPIKVHFVYQGSYHTSLVESGFFECPSTCCIITPTITTTPPSAPIGIPNIPVARTKDESTLPLWALGLLGVIVILLLIRRR